ncbi:hypothetical protein JHK82_038192 [Glycine max]|nr:hypothetical protein JHK85_038942 [Glycine max]KAG5114923.1 hypothetical protein JHK82_038192 [Glycine max]KAG5132203.1 hypothetical protein JHK84_038600 [Glycine max]
MTRLLRTIFIAQKLHLRNPKCIFPLLLRSQQRKPAAVGACTETSTTAQLRSSDEDKGKGEGKWWGQCPECQIVGTMNEFRESKLTGTKSSGGLAVSEDPVGSWLPQRPQELRPLKLEEINRRFNYQQWRIPLSGSFGNEVSTVLGGGLVPGSLTLVGGDPGIGKSTLLLQVQIAAMIAKECSDDEEPPVVYVSGEEVDTVVQLYYKSTLWQKPKLGGNNLYEASKE